MHIKKSTWCTCNQKHTITQKSLNTYCSCVAILCFFITIWGDLFIFKTWKLSFFDTIPHYYPIRNTVLVNYRKMGNRFHNCNLSFRQQGSGEISSVRTIKMSNYGEIWIYHLPDLDIRSKMYCNSKVFYISPIYYLCSSTSYNFNILT